MTRLAAVLALALMPAAATAGAGERADIGAMIRTMEACIAMFETGKRPAAPDWEVADAEGRTCAPGACEGSDMIFAGRAAGAEGMLLRIARQSGPIADGIADFACGNQTAMDGEMTLGEMQPLIDWAAVQVAEGRMTALGDGAPEETWPPATGLPDRLTGCAWNGSRYVVRFPGGGIFFSAFMPLADPTPCPKETS